MKKTDENNKTLWMCVIAVFLEAAAGLMAMRIDDGQHVLMALAGVMIGAGLVLAAVAIARVRKQSSQPEDEE